MPVLIHAPIVYQIFYMSRASEILAILRAYPGIMRICSTNFLRNRGVALWRELIEAGSAGFIRHVLGAVPVPVPLWRAGWEVLLAAAYETHPRVGFALNEITPDLTNPQRLQTIAMLMTRDTPDVRGAVAFHGKCPPASLDVSLADGHECVMATIRDHNPLAAVRFAVGVGYHGTCSKGLTQAVLRLRGWDESVCAWMHVVGRDYSKPEELQRVLKLVGDACQGELHRASWELLRATRLGRHPCAALEYICSPSGKTIWSPDMLARYCAVMLPNSAAFAELSPVDQNYIAETCHWFLFEPSMKPLVEYLQLFKTTPQEVFGGVAGARRLVCMFDTRKRAFQRAPMAMRWESSANRNCTPGAFARMLNLVPIDRAAILSTKNLGTRLAAMPHMAFVLLRAIKATREEFWALGGTAVLAMACRRGGRTLVQRICGRYEIGAARLKYKNYRYYREALYGRQREVVAWLRTKGGAPD